mgnify:CR=1 FL=1
MDDLRKGQGIIIADGIIDGAGVQERPGGYQDAVNANLNMVLRNVRKRECVVRGRTVASIPNVRIRHLKNLQNKTPGVTLGSDNYSSTSSLEGNSAETEFTKLLTPIMLFNGTSLNIAFISLSVV